MSMGDSDHNLPLESAVSTDQADAVRAQSIRSLLEEIVRDTLTVGSDYGFPNVATKAIAALKLLDEIENKVRQECALMASFEAYYWAGSREPLIEAMCFGGMGAASNLCGAFLLGLDADRYRESIALRRNGASLSGRRA